MGELIGYTEEKPHIILDNAKNKNFAELLVSKLAANVPAQFYNIFFTGLQFESNGKGVLRLMAPSESVAKHLKKRYTSLILECAKQAAEAGGKEEVPRKLDIVTVQPPSVQESLRPKNPNGRQLTPRGTSKRGLPTAQMLREKPRTPGREYQKNLFSSIDLNDAYTFESFVSGVENEYAFLAAKATAENPKSFHNPLFLYGGVGLGKTHLLMAIGNRILREAPWMQVLYVPAENFQVDLIQAIKNKTLDSFKAKYRSADVLLLDDIQFISKKSSSTQEHIFHTFNFLYQNKKQIVISSDRPPRRLESLTERLISRFQSGLIVDIKEPSLETRMRIIEKKAAALGVSVKSDVRRLMAEEIQGQVRPLEAALIKMKFMSEYLGKPMDRSLCENVLRDMLEESRKRNIEVEDIIGFLEVEFKVSRSDILGKKRAEAAVQARQAGMLLARKWLRNLNLKEIAEAFEKKDHTSVLHASKKGEALFQSNPEFRQRVEQVEKRIIALRKKFEFTA